MRLKDRKVIITGAAQGMGGVITRRLADEGAELFLTARTRAPATAPFNVTSTRRPLTSTTTDVRSASSVGSPRTPAYTGIRLSNSV